MNMKTINNIAVFDKDKCFLAMLKGYCYANNIAITELEFNADGINEAEKLKPVLIVIPLDWLGTENKDSESDLLRRAGASGQIKICGLVKNSTNLVSAELPGWIDVLINNPFDISEIDNYLKKNFVFNSCLIEERSGKERRSFTERRYVEFHSNSNEYHGYKEKSNTDNHQERKRQAVKGFRIDQSNKCLFLKGLKIDLTPREFELLDLLSTDTDRIFMTDEIINHLWPQSSRATKSDLYQYMHLLRKKIEKDSTNPQWIMNVKGFGYKLNIGGYDDMDSSLLLVQ
ncbi:MAG: winged helix-turn-helix domain-containing protein [Methylobacter sp.]